jgi:hypothetical protein
LLFWGSVALFFSASSAWTAQRADSARSKTTPSGRFSLQRAGDALYLKKGAQRLLLRRKGEWMPPLNPAQASLPEGYTLYFKNGRSPDSRIELRHHGTSVFTVSLTKLRDRWLQDESLWGDHSGANGMRYRNTHGGGFDVAAGVQLVQGNTVWIVINWRDLSPSVPPIVASFLVRINVSEKPTLTLVRKLAMNHDEWLTSPWAPPMRFYSNGRQIFFYDHDRLFKFPEGLNSNSSVAQFPGNLNPLGLLNGRWFILTEHFPPSNSTWHPLWFSDLRSKSKPRPIAATWQGEYYGQGVTIPKTGNRFLFQSPDQKTTRVITLPSGHILTIRNPPDADPLTIWQGFVLLVDQRTLYIYNAANGKRIQSLPYARGGGSKS